MEANIKLINSWGYLLCDFIRSPVYASDIYVLSTQGGGYHEAQSHSLSPNFRQANLLGQSSDNTPTIEVYWYRPMLFCVIVTERYHRNRVLRQHYDALPQLKYNFIALIAQTSFNNPPAFFLRMFSALASALTLLTAACADLVVTFCANHGWVWQKASFNSSSNVLLLRIAFSRPPLYSIRTLSFGSYRE